MFSGKPATVMLRISEGPEKGAVHLFDNLPVTIGRHPENDIVLKGAYISIWHGKIYSDGQNLIYEDLKSTNGSCVIRGADVLILDQTSCSKTALESGDQICLGTAKYPVVLDFETEIPNENGKAKVARNPQILESFPIVPGAPDVSGRNKYCDSFPLYYELLSDLNKVLEVSEAIEILGNSLLKIFHQATKVVILMKEGRQPRIKPVFSKRRSSKGDTDEKAKIRKMILRQVLKEGETVLTTTGIGSPLWKDNATFGLISVENRVKERIFTRQDMHILALLAKQASAVFERIEKSNEMLRESSEQTMWGFVKALEAKDRYTRGHSEQVALFSRLIADGMGLSKEEADLIIRAGYMHDIGKIGVEHSVLNKPGKLSDEEYEQVKRHPVIGKDIIENIDTLRELIPIVLHHHERFDGKGYPGGKKGDDIPLGARILAVADTYHAMTSDRAYRIALSHEEALQELRDNAGTQFDPRVVKIFVKELNRILALEKTVPAKSELDLPIDFEPVAFDVMHRDITDITLTGR
ncbi:HD domain-containing phosphohydrolase [Acidobacteriota bacterium]